MNVFPTGAAFRMPAQNLHQGLGTLRIEDVCRRQGRRDGQACRSFVPSGLKGRQQVSRGLRPAQGTLRKAYSKGRLDP